MTRRLQKLAARRRSQDEWAQRHAPFRSHRFRLRKAIEHSVRESRSDCECEFPVGHFFLQARVSLLTEYGDEWQLILSLECDENFPRSECVQSDEQIEWIRCAVRRHSNHLRGTMRRVANHMQTAEDNREDTPEQKTNFFKIRFAVGISAVQCSRYSASLPADLFSSASPMRSLVVRLPVPQALGDTNATRIAHGKCRQKSESRARPIVQRGRMAARRTTVPFAQLRADT